MQDDNSIEIFYPGVPTPLIIDIIDLPLYNKYNWTYNKTKRYLQRAFKAPHKKKYVTRTLQIDIMGVQENYKEVDHKNQNRMDNRRVNLRVCEAHQNCANRKKRSGSYSSTFKGVSWHKRIKKWAAEVGHKGKRFPLGYFEIEQDAAKAYNEAALKMHGEFAVLNIL